MSDIVGDQNSSFKESTDAALAKMISALDINSSHQDVSKLFSSAEPMSKDFFLSSYRRISLLAHLLTAPFGIADAVVDRLGEQFLVKELTPIYRGWEEVMRLCSLAVARPWIIQHDAFCSRC
jgi:hypothetical protein